MMSKFTRSNEKEKFAIEPNTIDELNIASRFDGRHTNVLELDMFQ